MQVIALGASAPSWLGYIAQSSPSLPPSPPGPPLPPPPSALPPSPAVIYVPAPSGLTQDEKVAVVVTSVVGGVILLALLAAVVYLLHKRRQRKWAPAKALAPTPMPGVRSPGLAAAAPPAEASTGPTPAVVVPAAQQVSAAPDVAGTGVQGSDAGMPVAAATGSQVAAVQAEVQHGQARLTQHAEISEA